MKESIFTKIINGEIPCHKVYEDNKVLAFLDIHPIQPGHTLVVPKHQINHFDDLNNDDYLAVFDTVKRVAKQQKRVLDKKRACVRIEGFDVPHAHVHVYPCDNPQEFYGAEDRSAGEPNHAELSEIAQRLQLK